MNKNSILLILSLIIVFPTHVYAEENQFVNKTHGEIYDKLEEIDNDSTILGINSITFGILSLIVSLIIATLMFVKQKRESDNNHRELKKHTTLTTLHQQGNLYYNTKDYRNALKHYDEYLKINPKEIKILHNIGATLEQLDLWSDAIPYYEKILEQDSNNTGALNNLGLAYEELGKFYDAGIFYYRGLEINIKTTDILNNIGKLYMDRFKNYDLAIHFFDRIINEKLEHGKELASVFVNKGLALSKQGNHEKAFEEFEKALELDRDNVKALNEKAVIFYRSGKFTESLVCSNLALRIDPTSYITLLNKANALMDLGFPNDALLCLDEYLMNHSKDNKAYFNKGAVYANYGQQIEAIQNFKKSIELDSQFIEAYGAIMGSYINLKNYPMAINYGQQALIVDSQNIEILLGVGICHCLSGQYQIGIFKYFYEVFKLQPTNLNALRNMSIAFAKLEDYLMANLCWEAYLLAQQFPN